MSTRSPNELSTNKPFDNLSFSEENIKRWDTGYLIEFGVTSFENVNLSGRFQESFNNLHYSSDKFTVMKNKSLNFVVSMPIVRQKSK